MRKAPMYVDAIEHVAEFTRPIHFISRFYGSDIVHPGAATLFFVNEEGWALTAGHVAGQLVAAENVNRRYEEFKRELATRRGEKKFKQLRRELEKKYGLNKSTTAELKNRFMNCVEGPLKFTLIRHKKADIALIRFEEYTRLLCTKFPVFAKDSDTLKPGKMLCRLGFPFAEFTNFQYDPEKDRIEWTESGKVATPRFPIEGMVTRRLLDDSGGILGFEMSTPGIRGQSGGPAYDTEGRIWGVQAMTKHLDLDFDVDQKVLRQGRPVQDSAFLHVGGCIHIEVVKRFLTDNNVSIAEA
jgi:hypothetical protein